MALGTGGHPGGEGAGQGKGGDGGGTGRGGEGPGGESYSSRGTASRPSTSGHYAAGSEAAQDVQSSGPKSTTRGKSVSSPSGRSSVNTNPGSGGDSKTTKRTSTKSTGSGTRSPRSSQMESRAGAGKNPNPGGSTQDAKEGTVANTIAKQAKERQAKQEAEAKTKSRQTLGTILGTLIGSALGIPFGGLIGKAIASGDNKGSPQDQMPEGTDGGQQWSHGNTGQHMGTGTQVNPSWYKDLHEGTVYIDVNTGEPIVPREYQNAYAGNQDIANQVAELQKYWIPEGTDDNKGEVGNVLGALGGNTGGSATGGQGGSSSLVYNEAGPSDQQNAFYQAQADQLNRGVDPNVKSLTFGDAIGSVGQAQTPHLNNGGGQPFAPQAGPYLPPLEHYLYGGYQQYRQQDTGVPQTAPPTVPQQYQPIR